MEETDQIPKEQNIDENSNNSELTDNNPESSGLLEVDGNNQKLDNLKSNKTDINKSQIFGEDSLIQRFLNKGIDGVTTNPNYKLLALLIILLINLSIFILIGNLGKSFLANSGLL